MPDHNRKYLKPADGLKVRNPQKGDLHLAPEGEWVDYDIYWRRRVRDRDVFESTPPRPAPAPKSGKKED